MKDIQELQKILLPLDPHRLFKTAKDKPDFFPFALQLKKKMHGQVFQWHPHYYFVFFSEINSYFSQPIETYLNWFFPD